MTKYGGIDLVGHISLGRSMDIAAERFIRLVEELDRAGVGQHVIVSNDDLAKRVAVYPGVRVGPVTGSTVIAYCLMPQADVIHAHGDQAGHAALLLALTRSIPYVMTSDGGGSDAGTRLQQAVLHRSMGRLEIGGRPEAARVLQSYRRAVARWRTRTMLV